VTRGATIRYLQQEPGRAWGCIRARGGVALRTGCNSGCRTWEAVPVLPALNPPTIWSGPQFWTDLCLLQTVRPLVSLLHER